ncbi:hypothetical protein SAMN04487866_1281, partial [Thermoactinomyces sp. DSM 45891]
TGDKPKEDKPAGDKSVKVSKEVKSNWVLASQKANATNWKSVVDQVKKEQPVQK